MANLILADKYGREIRLSETFKKAPAPKTGEAFGQWAGNDLIFGTLPGGAVLQFDLSRLTLNDFRMMRTHYQVNASLSLQAFMVHQIDWHIECENQTIADMIESNIRDVWTRMIRATSQAYWAGFAPTVIQYENTKNGVEISKFKDLAPEDCLPHWDYVEGYAPPGFVPPKIPVFGGIKQWGSSYPIPVENSLWYPLLMEHGDYMGRKLLASAFPSWFFSILMHLFANRYYERFGEPTPVGRYDSETEVEGPGGKTITGREAILNVLNGLRSRSVVALPGDRDPNTKEYSFDISYLESQMRGADFERYMTRLDEEISLGLFTPLLLLRTADVGSYNLGVGHLQAYLWMLNALVGDLKEYIDRYVIDRLKNYNFGPNAPVAKWVPTKMGRQSEDMLKQIAGWAIRAGDIKPDIQQLGQAVGLKFEEVQQVTAPPAEPNSPQPSPAPAK